LAFALLSAGCATSGVVRGELLRPDDLQAADSILVVPFENISTVPDAGTRVADLVADELRGWQGYAIRDRHTLAELVERGEAALPERWSRAEAIPMAMRTESRLVLTGFIHEYGYVREGADLSEIASLAVTMRLIATDSGRTIWSGVVLAKRGSDRAPGSLSLASLARDSIRTVFRDMFTALRAWQDAALREVAR
jgi:hypothetical protein